MTILNAAHDRLRGGRVLTTIVVLLLASAVAVAHPAPADAATAVPGTYVPFATQQRVADTLTGAGGNHKGAVGAGKVISIKVAGVAKVPSTGVGSVAVTVTASRATAGGGLVVYGGTRPATTNLRFAAGQAVTDAAIVPLASGRIHIANTATRGSVQVAVDVSGYYRSGAASASNPGILHVLATARRAVTLQPHGGAEVTAAIGGHVGVPAGAGAAAVTLTVTGATRAGTILAFRPDEPKQNLAVARFAAGQAVSSFAVVRLSGGATKLVNTSAATVHIAVDVAGWYAIGFAGTAQAYQTVVQSRLTTTHISARATKTVTVSGHGGVPLRSVSAVLVTVTVTGPGATGGMQAWRADVARPGSTTVLQFQHGRSASDVVLVPVSSSGKIALHNTSAATTGLAIDIDGYVPANGVTAPATGATARYVRNITGATTTDLTTMHDEGAADAAAGATFALLDIGAQANDETGVVLSATSTKISYADLVTAIKAYLDGFATAGHTGTVAVGTNNGADDWTNYSGNARGSDWANKVVQPLAQYAASGVTVIGADDLEAGFFSTEPEAEQWKAGFLGAMPGTGTALVFNGSADFCPKTWTTNAACNFGWTEQKLYGLAGGPRTVVLPQVYFGYMATEWAMIDKTGGGGLHFWGALTEHALDAGSLAPSQGWTALQRAVSSVTAQTIPRVADIHA